MDNHKSDDIKNSSGESLQKVALEICLPFLLAGFGMVLAGTLLDYIQYWPVFESSPQLFILVPALLGLKGNLEMTLASRLSTLANLLDSDAKDKSSSQYWSVAWANLALVQVQAVIVGTLAAIFALFMHWVSSSSQNGFSTETDLKNILMVLTSSVLTASIASFVLGIVMVQVVYTSKTLDVNPDNVATPIAASLGDLVTLAILAVTSSSIYDLGAIDDLSLNEQTLDMLDIASFDIIQSMGLNLEVVCCTVLLMIYFVAIAPVSFMKAKLVKETEVVLYEGWTPVLTAMVISSLGGTILNQTIIKYPKVAAYQPVINGVAGNLVAVNASRISTHLHQQKQEMESKDINMKRLHRFSSSDLSDNQSSEKQLLNSKDEPKDISLLLWFLVVPGHLVFNILIFLFSSNSGEDAEDLSSSSGNLVFLVLYLLAALIQVGILLYTSRPLVLWLWNRGVDPDSSSIPYLTSSGDLLGGVVLSAAFHINDFVGVGA